MSYKHWILVGSMSSGLALAGCGGAEVEADDDPGAGPSDFEAETQGDMTEGDFGADVDVSEDDEMEGMDDPGMEGGGEPY